MRIRQPQHPAADPAYFVFHTKLKNWKRKVEWARVVGHMPGSPLRVSIVSHGTHGRPAWIVFNSLSGAKLARFDCSSVFFSIGPLAQPKTTQKNAYVWEKITAASSDRATRARIEGAVATWYVCTLETDTPPPPQRRPAWAQLRALSSLPARPASMPYLPWDRPSRVPEHLRLLLWFCDPQWFRIQTGCLVFVHGALTPREAAAAEAHGDVVRFPNSLRWFFGAAEGALANSQAGARVQLGIHGGGGVVVVAKATVVYVGAYPIPCKGGRAAGTLQLRAPVVLRTLTEVLERTCVPRHAVVVPPESSRACLPLFGAVAAPVAQNLVDLLLAERRRAYLRPAGAHSGAYQQVKPRSGDGINTPPKKTTTLGTVAPKI